MCSLCGILGGRGHWADSATSPEAFARREERHTWQRERQTRTRLINRVLAHYGLKLQDWSGNAYVLRGRTGQTAIVNNLSEIWAEAERLSHKECDPLDDGLLRELGAR
tara:strand:- start:1240 stop:1563 length:324 start_codon:yes stop_codon:yes gene_type:complete